MKVLYRPQCGGLAEAMSKLKEFSSLKELLDYLIKEYKGAFNYDSIFVYYYCYDNRIDWDTYVICISEKCHRKRLNPKGIGFLTFAE